MGLSGILKSLSQHAAAAQEGCAPSSALRMCTLLPVTAIAEGIGFLSLSCSHYRRVGRNTEDQAAGASLPAVGNTMRKGSEMRCGWDDSGCVISLAQTLGATWG